ncbi:conserved hypothetical protein [Histoplasma mississippiense (nom. inval.)]|nr:conserved hypothetical protein [Histoplasma mississippiense (nom. inval.)]EDN04127.1 conserved hypothetical protein [Histoplasma mississippiense (nom. inval.)]
MTTDTAVRSDQAGNSKQRWAMRITIGGDSGMIELIKSDSDKGLDDLL